MIWTCDLSNVHPLEAKKELAILKDAWKQDLWTWNNLNQSIAQQAQDKTQNNMALHGYFFMDHASGILYDNSNSLDTLQVRRIGLLFETYENYGLSAGVHYHIKKVQNESLKQVGYKLGGYSKVKIHNLIRLRWALHAQIRSYSGFEPVTFGKGFEGSLGLTTIEARKYQIFAEYFLGSLYFPENKDESGDSRGEDKFSTGETLIESGIRIGIGF